MAVNYEIEVSCDVAECAIDVYGWSTTAGTYIWSEDEDSLIYFSDDFLSTINMESYTNLADMTIEELMDEIGSDEQVVRVYYTSDEVQITIEQA